MEPDDAAIDILSGNLGFKVRRRAAVAPGADPLDPAAPPVQARAAGLPAAATPIDTIIDRKSPALAAAFRGARAPVLAILQASQSREEFLEKLHLSYPDWGRGRIAGLVEEAMQIAAAKGIVDNTK